MLQQAPTSFRERAGRAWHRFWFREESTLALGVFRILFACCLLSEVGNTFANSQHAIAGGYHLPYVTGIHPVSVTAYEWIHAVQYPLIMMLGLGLFARCSCALLLLLQGYIFFADQLNFRNHPYFFLLVLLILAVSPAASALSIRSIVRGLRPGGSGFDDALGKSRPVTCQRLIQFQVCVVYFYAALQKINHGFLSGVVLSHYLSLSLTSGAVSTQWHGLLPSAAIERIVAFVQVPGNVILPSVFSLVLELTLPFALWFRGTRPAAIVLGILFHAAIAFLLGIHTFSFAMVASYVLFLDPPTLRNMVSRRGQDSRTTAESVFV